MTNTGPLQTREDLPEIQDLKILVIGAEGDIGRAVCAELKPRHRIITAGRNSGDIRADMADTASVEAMYRDAGPLDAVVSAAGSVHFGALSGFSAADMRFGLENKVMGQINLVLAGLHHLNDGGSFTLTSGILNRDPVRMGCGAATANGALDGFITGASIEMPRGLRLNVVSPGLLDVSAPRYRHLFPGHEIVSSQRVGRAYAKSVEGALTGQLFIVE